jgi:hypothetical protein
MIEIKITKTHLIILSAVMMTGVAASSLDLRPSDAVKVYSDIMMQNGNTIENVPPPSNGEEVANKNYVDAASSGGGDSMTVWGTTNCPSSYTKAYEGDAMTLTQSDHGTSSLACIKAQLNSDNPFSGDWIDSKHMDNKIFSCAKCVK